MTLDKCKIPILRYDRQDKVMSLHRRDKIFYLSDEFAHLYRKKSKKILPSLETYVAYS